MQKPDFDTIERIKNLAAVGRIISETSNEVSFDTDYFLAKDALQKFKVGIDNLDLDIESRDGMDKLINFLQKIIDQRLAQSD